MDSVRVVVEALAAAVDFLSDIAMMDPERPWPCRAGEVPEAARLTALSLQRAEDAGPRRTMFAVEDNR